MYTINVVHKRKHKATPHDKYCGRPSALGNRYTHKSSGTIAEVVVGSRDEAIARYKADFRDRIKNDLKFRAAFMDICNHLAEYRLVYLVCWCAPLSCHCDIIKEELLIYMETYPPTPTNVRI